MAKVVTFSTGFPAYHPKSGEPTNFVAGFQNSFNPTIRGETFFADFYDDFKSVKGDVPFSKIWEIRDTVNKFRTHNIRFKKYHTIRSGKRFKKGDYFSPRIWSAKPYKSPQIIVGPDTEIKQIWDISIFPNGNVYIHGGDAKINTATYLDSHFMRKVAKNDGLELQELINWFVPKPDNFKGFEGQIICWNENVNY